MNQPHATYDVLVIGAGPSGLTTAIAAARSGARVLLVDKHIGVSIFPKATGIRGRTMEIMRSWGLEDQVRSADMALPMTMAICRDTVPAGAGGLARLAAPWLEPYRQPDRRSGRASGLSRTHPASALS